MNSSSVQRIAGWIVSMCALAVAAPATAAGTGVAVLIDESGSMNGRQVIVRDTFATLAWSLALVDTDRAATDTGFAVVGFTRDARFLGAGARTLLDIESLPKALAKTARRGGTEDGYLAIVTALEGEPGSKVVMPNIVLFTDEDRDVVAEGLDAATLSRQLAAADVVLDAVVNARIVCPDGRRALGFDNAGVGYLPEGDGGFTQCMFPTVTDAVGTTLADYVLPALNSGGSVWDIDLLVIANVIAPNGAAVPPPASSFAQAFVDAKSRQLARQSRAAGLRARIVADVPQHAAGSNIALDGTQSVARNPETPVYEWRWDLDEDGRYDEHRSVTYASFVEPGLHSVGLKVFGAGYPQAYDERRAWFLIRD